MMSTKEEKEENSTQVIDCSKNRLGIGSTHTHARGADECANVDMERTTNAAREGEKVSSARWAFTLEALQIDRICTALSPSIFIAPLRMRNLS